MRVTVRGADTTARRLTLYGRRIATWRSLWRAIAAEIGRAERAWFATAGRGAWPALDEVYATWKAAHFPGKPILVREGDLRGSLTTGVALTEDSSARTLTIGTDVAHAEFHRTGTRHMPKRDPFIPIADARRIARGKLEEHVAYHAGRGGRPAGFA